MDFLLKLVRHPVFLVLFGDPAAFDRWLWLKRELTVPAKTLDAGCGSGAMALYSAYWGNETLGISFEERNNQIASHRAEILNLNNAKFITGDLRELDKRAKSLNYFDQIICFETIEHIMDDKKLLKDFFNLLNTDGRLFLTAPYKHYRRLPGDHVSSVENGDHVRWGYTHEEITDLLEKAGFTVLKKEYVSGFISQTLVRWHRHLARFNHFFSWIILFPLRVFVVLDPLLAHFLHYPHLSIAVVAEKKQP